MTAPTNTPQAETIREQFELAYATAWAPDSQRTETATQLAEVVKTWRDGDSWTRSAAATVRLATAQDLGCVATGGAA